MLRLTKTALAATSGALLFFLSSIVFAAPPLPGAIFTTDASGTIVNGNTQYALQCDVYLDGGPGPNAPQKAAGLPDGNYYYQVTDPSGKKLLSTDAPTNRCVTVSNGIIVSQCEAGDHGEGTSLDHGGITIQLCPYDRTPNPGGVYKAWMTPTSDFQSDPLSDGQNNCGNGCFHGFLPAASKTDNFKVGAAEQTYCIDIYKQIIDSKKKDLSPGAGWEIFFGGNSLYTDSNGFLEICGLVAGTYAVSESTMGGEYLVYLSAVNGTAVEPPTDSLTVSVGKNNDPDPGVVRWVNQLAPKKK